MSKIRIAHLSDPHFGTVLPEVKAALVRSLGERQPDLVLVSGDITQRARRSQFREAREFRQQWDGHFFAVPGNHDIPLLNIVGRLIHPYYGFHRHFQAKREADIRLDGVRVLGLNSTSRWRHVQGRLNVNRVRKIIFESWDDAKVRVAMIHHPLACAKDADNAENRLRGLDETFELFHEAKIDLVLSGHVHDPYVAVEKGLVLSTAGTCLSWRTRKNAPNSYHFIEIETNPRRISIVRMDHSGENFCAVAHSERNFLNKNEKWSLEQN